MEKTLKNALSLVTRLYEILGEKQLTVSTAESCTGGTLGAMLTHPAGASRYYMGSIVSYANEIKEALLGVSRDTLKAHGAVSPETCAEMAKGAKKVLGTSLTVAITGIAGPGGESPEKPQGLVYIATYDGENVTLTKNLFSGDRATVRLKTAEKALSMLIDAALAYTDTMSV